MPQPDSLDMAIMRELESPGSLRWNVRESYASISKRVGVDEDTVRRRISKMQQLGVIRGWELVVNPHTIGREAASLELQVATGRQKGQVLKQIEMVDGVISVLDFAGPSIQVGIYFRSERSLSNQVGLLESLCGSKSTALWRVDFPQFDLKLTRTDWLLLSAIRGDPRKRLGDIAAETKTSARTVNRRLTRMVEAFAFFLHASVDFGNLGGLAYRLLLRCDDPKSKAEIDRSVQGKADTIEWSYTYSPEFSMFVLYCENVLQSTRLASYVRSLAGVAEARMDLIQNQITVHEWIQDEVERRIASPHGIG